MNIYIYSDESGVFDCAHNDYFIFAGVICFGKDEKEATIRKYAHVESETRRKRGINGELKASILKNADKAGLFRSLNNVYKFCVRIKQKDLHSEIFENKKHKQRYLDYAYKMVLKKCFESLIESGHLNPNEVEGLYFSVDEHTTATDGRYELKEALLNEFKYGTFNFNWQKWFPPIFPKLQNLELTFCHSENAYLIRASDIICNHYFYIALQNSGAIKNTKNTFVYYLPGNVIVSKGLEYFSKSNSRDKGQPKE